MKYIFYKALIVSLSFLFTIIFIEQSSKIVIEKFIKDNDSFDYNKYILSKPSPFKGNADYTKVVHQLIDKNCKKKIIFDEKNKIPYFEKKFSECEAETVIDGIRKTHYQDKIFSRKIFFYGGSTLWGTGSSDAYTITSLFQKIVNEKNKKITAINKGFSSLVISQQITFLKLDNIKEGDIVVFFDGQNDIWQGAVYQNPQGNIIGYNQNNKFSIFFNDLKFFLNRHSNTYQLFTKLKNKENVCKKIELTEDQLKESFNFYISKILEAKSYTESKGAKFYHFFQPTLLAKNFFTEHENYMISTIPSEIMPCGTFRGPMQVALNYYIKNYSNIPSDVNSENLSSIFDSYKDDFYIDLAHITGPGNAIIAERIFNKIYSDEK